MKLKDCCTIIAGQSPESRYYNMDGIGLPFFQGKADFGRVYPQIRMYCSKPIKIAEKNDILLSVRAPVGPTNLAPCKSCIGRGIAALRPTNKLNIKYLLYFFRHYEIQLQQKGTGTTFKAITQETIRNLDIPVPTLSEQECIVTYVEKMFSQLDQGLETLKKIKQQLAVYRQAVLKEAFEGVINKQPIREIASVVTSGSRGWAKYYSNDGARFIRITDLTRDTICLKDDSIQYVLLPNNVEGKRSRLMPDDVLVSITADLGSIALVPGEIGEAYINQHIAMIRFKNPYLGKYMAWYLKSDFGQKDLLKNKRGGGKLGLGLDDIRNTPVPIVTNDVAKSVTEQVNAHMSICNSIKQTIDVAIQQAEVLRQSVLRKAFKRGLQ